MSATLLYLRGILPSRRRDRSLSLTVRSGWNDFEWSKAKIVKHEKAAEGVSLFEISSSRVFVLVLYNRVRRGNACTHRSCEVSLIPACVQLVKITVDMGPLAKEYTKGGQYFQIKVGDSKPAYYVIASAPGAGQPLEVIVKNQGDTAEILCDSKPGPPISASTTLYSL